MIASLVSSESQIDSISHRFLLERQSIQVILLVSAKFDRDDVCTFSLLMVRPNGETTTMGDSVKVPIPKVDDMQPGAGVNLVNSDAYWHTVIVSIDGIGAAKVPFSILQRESTDTVQ